MQVIVVSNQFILNEYKEIFKKENLDTLFVTDDINEDANFNKYNIDPKLPKILAISTPQELRWKCDQRLIEKLGNVKGICTKSSWLDYIDLPYCRKNNIIAINNVGINSQSVAENAIFMMFALARKLPLQMSEHFESFANNEHEHIELEGKTVGIIGLGHIGKRVAKLCTGLGMKVIYWSRKSRDESFKYIELDELVSNSDVIIDCIEINESTAGFVNKAMISKMKKNTLFASVIGGCGVKTEDDLALIQAVVDGKLGGYAIENEHHKEFVMPKIPAGTNIFMPGAYGYFTKEANDRAFANWMKNIKAMNN